MKSNHSPEHLIQHYLKEVKALSPLFTADDLELLALGLRTKHISRGEHYLLAGKAHPHMAYIAHGLMRVYYIDSNGNEVSVDFLASGQYTADYDRAGSLGLSPFYFQALEECHIIEMTAQHFDLCLKRIPSFALYAFMSIDKSRERLLARLRSFLLSNAEERYQAFLESHAHLMGRLSVGHIASYLGVSRQALTKIRQRRLQSLRHPPEGQNP